MRQYYDELQVTIEERDKLKVDLRRVTAESERLGVMAKDYAGQQADVATHVHDYYKEIAELEGKLEREIRRNYDGMLRERELVKEVMAVKAGPI